MTDINTSKTFKLGNGLRIFISSLYIALFILSAGDLLRSFETIREVWNDTSFLDERGLGQPLVFSLIVATFSAILLPVGSLYLTISGFRGKHNSRWILVSTIFSSTLILLTVLVSILFAAQGFASGDFVLGWRSFVSLYLNNSYGYADFVLGSRELLITISTILVAVISLVVLLTNKKTFLTAFAKRISKFFAPVSKRIAELWAPLSKQLSSRSANKPSESESFARTILDVSFNKFIYIKVSSLLYFIFLALVGLFNALLVLAVMVGVTAGSVEPEYILLIPASFIVSILFVVLMRLAFESGIALIKIAENTSKK
jgi:hypothetical protein